MSTPALRASDLTVRLPSGRALVQDIDLSLHPGRVLALVGPSGAGKSLTLRALAGLLPAGLSAAGYVVPGDAFPSNENLLKLSRRRLRRVRGTCLAWVGQDATPSLNPTITVGAHMTESLEAHTTRPYPVRVRSRDQTRERGTSALASVGLSDPGRLWDAYPFELSGGQAQRVALALATVADPPVLLADEVTAELDVVSMAEILALLRGQADAGRAVLLVTHDLPAAARWADDVAVLESGRVVELGPSDQILRTPSSSLTRQWAQAASRVRVPGNGSAPERSLSSGENRPSQPDEQRPPQGELTCRGLGRVLRGHGRQTQALAGVDLHVRRGEALAVVGRSGSGKSTLVGVLAALDRPDTGHLLVDGIDVWALPSSELRAVRRRVGLVFQDALSSFDPRYTVRQVIAEALSAGGDDQVAELLRRVDLDVTFAARRPATLSGGQRQRVALARALAGDPAIILADEPTSGLDVLAQEHLIKILDDARASTGLTVLLITHDLRLAQRIAERVVVLDDGKIVDDLPTSALDQATQPVTRELLNAASSTQARELAG